MSAIKPTLRRASSSSNIPRLSRTSGRSSHIPKPRSSSARPTSISRPSSSTKPSSTALFGSATKSGTTNSNLLQVFGTYGRSSSYSNLLTPSQSARKLSVTPTSTSKHAKPSDKDWQKNQLQRVRKYFLDMDPEIPPLKPLGAKFYVDSMNILLHTIDARFSITSKNFKEFIPECLKLIKYPYPLKPSVMKQPTVPSNFPYILQMWVWLIDFIEDLENSENIIFGKGDIQMSSKLFQRTIEHIALYFVKYNGMGQKEAMQEVADIDNIEELINIFSTINDVDVTKLQISESEEMDLDSELASLKVKEDKIYNLSTEVSKKLIAVTKSNSTYLDLKSKSRADLLNKIKELHVQQRNIQMNLKQRKEIAQHLKNELSVQRYTKDSLRQLKVKITESNNTSQLKMQYNKKLEGISDGFKPVEEKRKIESLIYEINGKCVGASYQKFALEKLKIPVEHIGKPIFLKDLKKCIDETKMLVPTLDKESEDLEKKLKQQDYDRRMEEIEAKEISLEIEKLVDTEKDRFEAQNRWREELNLQCFRPKNIELHKQLQDLESRKPNLMLIKNQLEESLARQNREKIVVEKMIEKGERFAIKLCGDTQRLMNAQQEVMDMEDIDNMFSRLEGLSKASLD